MRSRAASSRIGLTVSVNNVRLELTSRNEIRLNELSRRNKYNRRSFGSLRFAAIAQDDRSAVPLSVVFAQSQAQLMRLAPRHAQSARYQAAAHQLHAANNCPHRPRSPPVRPYFAERPYHSISAGVVHA